MSSILVINAAGRETRVALVENGQIAEFYLERKKDKGIVGNIYKGRVTRVLPGMQAAFVEIGQEKAAFLYVSDVYYDPEFSKHHFELTEGEHDEAPEVPDADAEDAAPGEQHHHTEVSPPAPTQSVDAAVEAATPPEAGVAAPAPSTPVFEMVEHPVPAEGAAAAASPNAALPAPSTEEQVAALGAV